MVSLEFLCLVKTTAGITLKIAGKYTSKNIRKIEVDILTKCPRKEYQGNTNII